MKMKMPVYLFFIGLVLSQSSIVLLHTFNLPVIGIITAFVGICVLVAGVSVGIRNRR